MPGESKNAKKVAPCIIEREGGTFGVSVRVNMIQRRKSFPTLAEAVAWRDEQIAQRKRREMSRGRDRFLMSPEDTEERLTVREALAKAPRSVIERDGRVWTLVSLPPTTGGAT